MVPHSLLCAVQIVRGDQPLSEQPLAEILDEIEKDRSSRMSWRIGMHDWIDSDLDEARFAKQAWHLATDIQVNPGEPRIGTHHLDEKVPFGNRRIA